MKQLLLRRFPCRFSTIRTSLQIKTKYRILLHANCGCGFWNEWKGCSYNLLRSVILRVVCVHSLANGIVYDKWARNQCHILLIAVQIFWPVVQRSGSQTPYGNWMEEDIGIRRRLSFHTHCNFMPSIKSDSSFTKIVQLTNTVPNGNWIYLKWIVKMKYCFLGALLLISLNAVVCRKSREIRIVSANTKYYDELVNKMLQFRNRNNNWIVDWNFCSLVFFLQSLHTIIQASIDHSSDLVLKNCQKQFRWDRWNCPTADFHAKRTSMQLDRETAFVQTLTMAALIYTVAKNCSQREIKGCECNSVTSLQKFDGYGPTTVYDCSDQIEKIGERIAANLFSSAIDTRFDGQAYANLHNNRAARIVSIEQPDEFDPIFLVLLILLRFCHY